MRGPARFGTAVALAALSLFRMPGASAAGRAPPALPPALESVAR